MPSASYYFMGCCQENTECHGAIVECSSDSHINYAQSFHQSEWLSVGLAHLVHHRGTTPIILAAAFFSMLTLLHACCVFVMLLFILQSSCCHTCVVMPHINVLVKPVVSSLRAILSIAFTFNVPHLNRTGLFFLLRFITAFVVSVTVSFLQYVVWIFMAFFTFPLVLSWVHMWNLLFFCCEPSSSSESSEKNVEFVLVIAEEKSRSFWRSALSFRAANLFLDIRPKNCKGPESVCMFYIFFP